MNNSIELHKHGDVLIGGTTHETATAVIMTALDGDRALVLREGWQQHAALIQSLCPGFDASKDHPLGTPIDVESAGAAITLGAEHRPEDMWALRLAADEPVTGTMVIRGGCPGQGTTNLLKD